MGHGRTRTNTDEFVKPLIFIWYRVGWLVFISYKNRTLIDRIFLMSQSDRFVYRLSSKISVLFSFPVVRLCRMVNSLMKLNSGKGKGSPMEGVGEGTAVGVAQNDFLEEGASRFRG